MTHITEGLLRFEFPNDWTASKFDEWRFYRKQFIRIGNAVSTCGACSNQRDAGVKAIDILAIGPGSVCWQIEIKDYRRTKTSNFLFLADEVAIKVRDTLACLAAARLNATESDEKRTAQKALRCS